MALALLAGLILAAGCGLTERMFPSDHAEKPQSQAAAPVEADQASLKVSGGLASDGVAPAESSLFSDLRAVWVGSFLDPEPAAKSVSVFQRLGLASFTVKKTLVSKGLFSGDPIGDYHLVLVGLFGEHADAEALGRRLQAQGLVANWQVVPSDDPGEMGQAQRQTERLSQRAGKVAEAAQGKAGQPLSADAPAATGEAFKNLVEGRFVGSFRDYQRARQEAERLSAGGWPASVVSDPGTGGLWYRVILAQPSDHRDFRAPPGEIERAQASAASQEGLVFLVDTSGAKGVWGRLEPSPDRRDASACAGFSRAGRLMTCLERLIGYIPDTGILVAVKPIGEKAAAGLVDRVVRPVRSLVTGDRTAYTEAKSAYGPAIYNRPDMMARIRALEVGPDPVPMSPALDGLGELAAIPGRKTVIVYSEFGLPSDAEAAVAAMGRLRGQYGDSLRVHVVYGDPDGQGWLMAGNLAKAAGAGQPWDGCRLLADNAYFEKFVKTVFSR
ncbi:MAG: hypothetical protein LBP92_13010 [Deltaproteobacteria bacterium]|jgi:hypothetical protein|nr:hypothetical protein [Deltaproteobacteria bacterium]